MSQNSLVELLPRYQRVRWELEHYLAGLAVGQKIMAEHEIADRFKVSRVTTRKALGLLRDEGIIESVRGCGTFYVRAITPQPHSRVASKVIGLLVPTVNDAMIAEIVHGVETAITRRGYHLILTHDHGQVRLQISQLNKMLDANVAGILLYPDRGVTERREFRALLKKIDAQNIPLVLLDRYIDGVGFQCVMTDNVSGMYQVTERLIHSGRKRVALIGFWEGNTSHIARRRGFVAALRNYGLPPDPVMEGCTPANYTDRYAYSLVANWVKGCRTRDDLPFDGIVCMSDFLAYEAFDALHEAGFRIPEDVALVGFDNMNTAAIRSPLQLTTVQHPLEDIGLTAAGLLIDQLENKSRPIPGNHILLPPKLVLRTSCGSTAASSLG